MAPSDLAERLAFLFPTTFVADGQPAAPDPDDHLELRRLVTLDLALPEAANDLEARALSTFVDLRAYFARLVLADLGGAWQTVVRLLDDGWERDEVLGEINGVLTDHVLEPLASGSDVDVAEVHRALDRLGRSEPLDDEIEELPWLISEWRDSGNVADDEIAGIVREVIHPAVLDVIGDGVRTVDEVAAPFATSLRLGPTDASDVVAMYLEWFTNAVVVTPRGNVALKRAFVDRLRFRHVVTAAEAATERLEVGVDLAVPLDSAGDLRLPDGASLRTTFRAAVDGPESRRGLVQVIEGPPGWLGGLDPGEQVAVRRDGDELLVEPAEPAEAPEHVLDALRQARQDLDLPTDVYRVVEVAAVDAGGLGPDLGAPLSELLAASGWAVRGDELAESGYDWDAAQAERGPRGRASVMDRAGVDPAMAGQVEHLVEELFGPGNWFHATEPLPLPADRSPAVARLLGRDGVAGAVWSLGVGPGPEPATAEAVLALAQQLLDGCSRTEVVGPARLASLAAATLDRVDLLPDLLRLAAIEDSSDPSLCAIAADVALDRGDVDAARRHQRRGWLPPGELLGRMDRVERSYTAGRNERCPCGSGQKFKRCHGDVRPRTPTDEERAQLLAVRLDRHATRRLTLTHRLARRAGLVEDDQWWVDDGELAEPFLRAVTWFAGGVLADHLATRGLLLSTEDRALEEAWSGAELAVGRVQPGMRIELVDGRVLDAPVGIGGSFVLPSSTSVGWVVPVGGTPTFLFGAMVEADVATAADAFTGASDVDAIADALGRLWRRERTTTS